MKKMMAVFFLILFTINVQAGILDFFKKKTEKENKVYFGLFREGAPRKMFLIERFEKKYNFRPHIIMWYLDWNQPFPLKDCLKVLEYGAIPQIIWEPWIWGDFDAIRLQNILDGEWDSYIYEWAKGVKRLEYPILIRFAHEFNIEGYSWSLKFNGKDPQKYIKAFRYVVDKFREVGAYNAFWIWCPMNYSFPDKPWNDYTKAYPGDDYVDWIGIDGYNWGNLKDWSQWQSFETLFAEPVRILSRQHPKKPIMIGEFASAIKGGNKAKWVEEIPGYLKTTLKQIKAICYFDLKKEADWRIKSPPNVVPAFQKIMQDSIFKANLDNFNTLKVDYSKSLVKKNIKIFRVKTPITIDGLIDDWNKNNFVSISSIRSISSGGGSWNGDLDLSAKAQFAYDQDYLYCVFDVTDDYPINNQHEKDKIWNGDGVELVFSINPNANPNRTVFQKTDYQIGLSTGDYIKIPPSIWSFKQALPIDKGKIRVMPRNQGYILEAKIPWSALNYFKPERGQKIGFTFAIDDADTESTRETQMLFSGDYLFYKDPSVWGTATFK